MSHFRNARERPYLAAQCIEALVHDGHPRDKRAGALLVAEHFALVRALARGFGGK